MKQDNKQFTYKNSNNNNNKKKNKKGAAKAEQSDGNILKPVSTTVTVIHIFVDVAVAVSMQYTCASCGKGYLSQGWLQWHINNKHETPITLVDPLDLGDVFQTGPQFIMQSEAIPPPPPEEEIDEEDISGPAKHQSDSDSNEQEQSDEEEQEGEEDRALSEEDLSGPDFPIEDQQDISDSFFQRGSKALRLKLFQCCFV